MPGKEKNNRRGGGCDFHYTDLFCNFTTFLSNRRQMAETFNIFLIVMAVLAAGVYVALHFF